MVELEPRELVVSSWGGVWDSALRHAVSDPFTERTGIPVRHATHVGLALPAELIGATRARRRPPCDVVWSNVVPAVRAARAGLCEPLTPEVVAALRSVHPRARPPGVAGWPLAPAYVVAYVLVFRRAAFPDGPPVSWRALLDPRHRGRVALYPDGNGIHAVAQVLGGGDVTDIPARMDPCWEWLRELRPQVGALDYSVGMERRLQRGELDMCFRALPNALGFQAAGADVGFVAPGEGVPDTLDVLWIPRGLPPDRIRVAAAYVGWCVSRRVQEAWCDRLGALPVRADAAAPSVLRQAPGMPCSLEDRDRFLHVPDTVKVDHEDDWRERFRAIFAV